MYNYGSGPGPGQGPGPGPMRGNGPRDDGMGPNYNNYDNNANMPEVCIYVCTCMFTSLYV